MIFQRLIDAILRFIRAPLGLSQEQVRERLAAKAAANPEKLDWEHSVVDLMKLVGMDSSLENRKKMAKELGYTGALNGSAEMNIWLHDQVMKKSAFQ